VNIFALLLCSCDILVIFIYRRWAVTSDKGNWRVSAVHASVARVQVLVSRFIWLSWVVF